MAQEEHISNSNSNGGGIGNKIFGRFSMKQRPKKVPQRGLGVAQLEKIRIEEQQKKDASILPSSQSPVVMSLPSPTRKSSVPASASCLPLPVPDPMFGPPFSAADTVPWTCNGSVVHNGQNKLWGSCEFEYNNIEKECSGLDPGLASRTNLSLPYEFEPIWPLPGLMQRAAQQTFQQTTSSVMNLSSRTSSTSVLNFQMEPPSNQNYYGNCTPLLPEDDKVVGMKRSYPFSLDNAPGPPIFSKYPPIVHSINGQVETASCSNCSTFNFEPGTLSFREGPSCSTSNMESKSKKSIKQNGVFDGDFLTLAPPTTEPVCSSSKFKHPSSVLPYDKCELPYLESLAYQASFEELIVRRGVGGVNQLYRPYYSFLPPAMVQIDRATTIYMTNCKGGEVGRQVDLNLKL
ncbi:Actin cytoskeleton-regulatory complex protein pan1, putative isoform 2 [Hibiscus syriacus]|uniref:Actin cytoskeleton-regulatory complex protein pan1, putative isoform 2 n=1 Tax=Hibiscus syriacus TaxID=106335 RepID=A0A6A2X9I4_HIBSY|nr:uncharacterized protein LOC120172550 [Hibiscus syriacus]KAE8672063.1 Actin cytoskeleton-regulatory complex protein pan1, putative isoform 2 [Hibiscus syriacus]